MLLAFSFISLSHLGALALMVLGFGFVIFWHELGHFLAAKRVGIKVDQFAVGFGQAVFSWRKGIGFRFGNTQKAYRDRIEAYLTEREKSELQLKEKAAFTEEQYSAAATELGLGDTEYRLNWLPLGGYVKMLGQDDLKPDATADDPRAYNKKSIGQRMQVISAGVIMNVILAAIGFMILFLCGFNVMPAWAGNVVPGSPAAKAGLQVGDHITMFDGKTMDDFTKATLGVALVKAGEPVTIEWDRDIPDPKPGDPNHVTVKHMTGQITPARSGGEKGFLQIGFMPPPLLKGPKVDPNEPFDEAFVLKHGTQDELAVKPGDVITKVNGVDVKETDYVKFDDFLQNSHGKPVILTIHAADGKTVDRPIQPHFEEPFGETPFNLAGMVPRATIVGFVDDSPLMGKAKAFDVIDSVKWNAGLLPHPTRKDLTDFLNKSGNESVVLEINLLRDTPNGVEHQKFSDIKTVKLDKDHRGLAIQLVLDEVHPVIGKLLDNKDFPNGPTFPKAQPELKADDRITKITTTINGVDRVVDVKTWYDVHRALSDADLPAATGAKFTIEYQRDGKQAKSELSLDKDQLASVREVRYVPASLKLQEYIVPRQTSNPMTAAWWGVKETRDFILQFYVTLKRMADGSVSPSNMMGPLGIATAGRTFAYRGNDWLLWFLAMISANLAVVNFLPIPVVDGGQFMFLIFEKIKGKPLSPRAMAIAQYCGLAFLAAVVLYVTYNDITRFF